MDITQTLKKLTNSMLAVYRNVSTIINDVDTPIKTNQEDLIALVEAIENVKCIISKKKSSLKSPVLNNLNDDLKYINEKIQAQYSSLNYKENHNLPEYDYQGIPPFSTTHPKLEESKVDTINDPRNLFKEFGYDKAVEKLGDLELIDNESNLFGEKNSKHTNESESPCADPSIQFLNNIVNFKSYGQLQGISKTLLDFIAENKVVVKDGKILNVGQEDQIMDEEKEPSVNSPPVEEPALGGSLINDAKEELDVFGLESNQGDNIINPNDEDIHMVDNKEMSPTDRIKEEPDEIDEMFIGINDKNQSEEDLDGFGSLNGEDPFNDNMKGPSNNVYKNYNQMNYSCDMFESERPFETLINPIDVSMGRQRFNPRYMEKMRNHLKSTLKSLIQEKKAERAQQDDIITKYNSLLAQNNILRKL